MSENLSPAVDQIMNTIMVNAIHSWRHTRQIVTDAVDYITFETKGPEDMTDDELVQINKQLDMMAEKSVDIVNHFHEIRNRLMEVAQIMSIIPRVVHEACDDITEIRQRMDKQIDAIDKLQIDTNKLISNIMPTQIEKFYQKILNEIKEMSEFRKTVMKKCFEYDRTSKILHDHEALHSPQEEMPQYQAAEKIARDEAMAAKNLLKTKTDNLIDRFKSASKETSSTFTYYYSQYFSILQRYTEQFESNEPHLPIVEFSPIVIPE